MSWPILLPTKGNHENLSHDTCRSGGTIDSDKSGIRNKDAEHTSITLVL